MYVCMIITYRKGRDQSGKVANPARGQLNRENVCMHVWSYLTGHQPGMAAKPPRGQLNGARKLALELTIIENW